jgi:Zn-finger nucleic acid-binding protein
MNCPACGAPMHPVGDHLQCDYCRNVVVPDADEDGVRVLAPSPDKSCPVCSVPLNQAALADTQILYCSKCHGELVGMTILQPLVDELRVRQGGKTAVQPPAGAHDLERRIACPACHQTMDAHYYAGPGNVVLDSCETCELIWLDRGELAHIAHAPDSFSAEADG